MGFALSVLVGEYVASWMSGQSQLLAPLSGWQLNMLQLSKAQSFSQPATAAMAAVNCPAASYRPSF